MIKLVDVTYYTHTEFNRPDQVWAKHQLVTRYAELLKDKLDILFVKHAGFKNTHQLNNITYQFFTGINKFWYVPFAANNYIGKQKPDVIIVQGLGFPVQTIMLRLYCHKQCKIMVQHHGELPLSGLKLWFQRFAGKFVDGYIFTGSGNARLWRQNGIVTSQHRLFEVLEASTDFVQQDKQQSRLKLQLPASHKIFLWVGRLNANKDPLTVLKAFSSYLTLQPGACLYMIYQSTDLLPEINDLLDVDSKLKAAVKLVGEVSHADLPAWYSAADYFISGSFKEGSGYALIEAMACGCIPVVTDIPSFRKITGKGRYGHLYAAGNVKDLYLALRLLEEPPKFSSADVVKYFNEHLSFKGIAHDVYWMCRKLMRV